MLFPNNSYFKTPPCICFLAIIKGNLHFIYKSMTGNEICIHNNRCVVLNVLLIIQ